MKHSIQFDYVKLKPSEQIGSHQQPTWELSLIIKGEGIRTIAEESEQFKSGEVVLVPPEVSHCWQFNDNVDKIENITVTFAPELLHILAATFPELQTIFGNLAKSSMGIVFTGKTRLRLHNTIITCLNEHRLSVACNLLQHSSLTIQQVCYESGFNDIPHFCRVFKRKFGVTPKEYRGLYR